MKVKDLIEKLKEFDEDLEVVGIEYNEYGNVENLSTNIDVYTDSVNTANGLYSARVKIWHDGKYIETTKVTVLCIDF
jgi:hypothetical protein